MAAGGTALDNEPPGLGSGRPSLTLKYWRRDISLLAAGLWLDDQLACGHRKFSCNKISHAKKFHENIFRIIGTNENNFTTKKKRITVMYWIAGRHGASPEDGG